jgi:hypothetical protein
MPRSNFVSFAARTERGRIPACETNGPERINPNIRIDINIGQASQKRLLSVVSMKGAVDNEKHRRLPMDSGIVTRRALADWQVFRSSLPGIA